MKLFSVMQDGLQEVRVPTLYGCYFIEFYFKERYLIHGKYNLLF